MAGTSSLRSPSATPIAEDDPFAELTRIIGFDPRVKVQQEAPAEPDFGIDLERELMGDFGPDEDVAPASQAAPVEAAEFAQQLDTYSDSDAVDPLAHVTPPAPHFADESLKAAELDASSFPSYEDAAPEPVFAADSELEQLPLDQDLPAPDASDEAVADVQMEAVVVDPAGDAPEPEAEADLGLNQPGVADPEAVFGEAEFADGQDVEAPTDQAFADEPAGQVAFEEAPAVEAPSAEVEPSEAAPVAATPFYDDELEKAFAALEAWERGDASAPRGASQPHHEPLPAVGAGDDAAEFAEPELHASEPELQTADVEWLAEDHGDRDQFTAEEGWTDEGAVSLHEPQVLHTGSDNEAVAESDSFEPVAHATAAEPEADLAEAFDNEFEQELFDLLGENGAFAADQRDGAGDDSWLDDAGLNEALLADDFEADESAGSAEEPAEPRSGWATTEEVARDQTLQAESEQGAYPERPDVTLPAVAAFPEHDFSPPPASSPEVVVDLADDEIAAGDQTQDDPFLAELDRFEMSLNELMLEEEPGEQHPDPFAAADPLVGDAAVSAALEQSDPVDDVSEAHPMEPEPMQPFNERAFDAALAEELGFNDAQGSEWNQGRGAGGYAGAAAASGYAAQSRPFVNAPAMHADVPDIETVDFVDQRVAPADELDLPEVNYGREERPAAAFDDFDAEFASAFNALSEEPAAQPQAEEPRRAPSRASWEDNLDFSMAAGVAAASAAPGTASSLSRAGLFEPEEDDRSYEDARLREQRHAKPVRRRGLVLGGAAAALVLLGGVAYLALPTDVIGNGEPAVVRADADPLKVRPENPGGIVVPNQENAVYERVGSGQLPVPTQERLITSVEEPIDLAANSPQDEFGPLEGLAALDSGEAPTDLGEDATGTVKAEDRILPDENLDAAPLIPDEMIAVAPRKVRTMVVRPDGTLVPREEAAPAPAPVEVASAAEAAISPEPAVVQPQPAAALPEATPAQAPAQAPVAAAMPAPEPEPQPAPQVAAVEPQAAPTAAPEPVEAAAVPSGWSVQIASQPTEASAKESYENLSRRYASVLDGRPVNIVKADIAGKGTYYRVRIQASSRAEANSICSSYKSAGGSCFVSQ